MKEYIKNLSKKIGAFAVLCAILPVSFLRADFIVGAGVTVTVTNNVVLDFSGGIIINGVLDVSGANPGNLRLTGNWNKPNTGIFVWSVSTVTFYDVLESSITGNTTFYALYCQEPGKTLQFQQNSTQTILNSLNVGNTSLSNEVKLRSTTNGKVWTLNIMNFSRHLDYVDVQDGNATGNSIKACNSLDNGGNHNWLFPGNLSVSLNTNLFDFGNVPIGGSTQTAYAILVTNNGCGAESFQLNAATGTPGTPWTTGTGAASAPGNDAFLLSAVFHNVMPSTATASQFGPEDVVNTTKQTGDATRYSAGVETGVSVPADEKRDLWFFLQMPLSTSTTWQQKINATVTATP